jgi:hypothetical protein
VSEGHIVSIFRVDYFEQVIGVKACDKPSNRLAGNFRKQDGNGIVDLDSHGLSVGKNEITGLSHDHRLNQLEKRI